MKRSKKIPKPRSIAIVGKRWWDRINGNTYCSADVYFDGVLVAEVPFEYGYGSFYRQAAFAELKRLKLVALKENESDWSYCDRMGIKLLDVVQDGCKKSELKKTRTINTEGV
jgi:hypothetical protein